MDVQTGHAGAQDAVGAPFISRHLRAPDRPQGDHPDGSDAWAPAKPRPDETLIHALARAHRRKRLLARSPSAVNWTGRPGIGPGK